MTYKSALEIIREHCDPGGKTFHSNSRAPFDYEQPVIDAAKEAMKGMAFKQPQAQVKVRHIVPAWLYENTTDPVQRTHQVEAFMHKTTYVANDLEAHLPTELFDYVYMHESVKPLYTYFAGASAPKREDLAPGKRWIKISRTLFVEGK